MSIDNITGKIISDAAEYAEGLILEAREEAKAIISQAREEVYDIGEQAAARSHEDAVSIKHRSHSAARLEARKLMLASKHKAVDKALEAAVRRLAEMEPDAYVAFLAGKIAETNIMEGELLLNAKDRATVGDKLVSAANRLSHGVGIILSGQTADIRGGFILKRGALEINSSLEAMVNSVKESVAPAVLAILYPGADNEKI